VKLSRVLSGLKDREPRFFGDDIYLSPDGKRIGAVIRDTENNKASAWVFDVATGAGNRLTFGDPAIDVASWSADGKRLAFSDPDGKLYTQPADGSSPPALLFSDVFSFSPNGWSPDGKLLAVDRSSPHGLDIYILPLSGDKKPYPFITGPGWDSEGSFSADGKWFVYVTDESGRPRYFRREQRLRAR
jgi:Tol biopolymer transport system component